MTTAPAPLYRVEDGRLRLSLHAGQARAWDSRKRFVAVLAGAQSGKTTFGPLWLWREIQDRGPGDYLGVTSTYDLFKLKMLPTLRELFEDTFRCGRYWSGDRVIEIADPATGRFLAKRADDPMYARIILRSAEAGGGLESTTAKGAWLDEAGQDSFKVESWEAILRRLALNQGRALITTTLYNFGWLKTQLYDPWAAGKADDVEVISFDSTENPTFPVAEMERARASMPSWRFNLQYRGRFERPAGLIYDSFDPKRHKIPRFTIPAHWPRLLGLDFGGANTAGMFYAVEPGTNRLFGYREYHAGGLTAADHARALLAGEPMIPWTVGGSPSEQQWRDEFRAGGLPVLPPDIKSVELGIDRVYGGHKRHQILVFDDLAGYLKQKESYSRKLDAHGEPTAEIDKKSAQHLLDAERAILGWFFRNEPSGRFGTADNPTAAERYGT